MTKTVRTWVFSAIVILIVIIGCYMSLVGPDNKEMEHADASEIESTIHFDSSYIKEVDLQ